MNRIVVKVGFTLCFLIVSLAGWLKIIHADNADTYLIIGLIVSYLCMSIAIYEMFLSKTMKTNNKMIWLFAFITTGWIALLLYAFISRNRVGNNNGVNNNLRTT